MGHAVPRTAAAAADGSCRRVGHLCARCGRSAGAGLLFGLVIPNLGETEIFEPICQAHRRIARRGGPRVAVGARRDPSRRAKSRRSKLCGAVHRARVAGVFFAPLEFSPHSAEINRRVMKMLRDAGIAVVLLDRRPEETAETALRPGRHRQPSRRLSRHRASAATGRARVGFLG